MSRLTIARMGLATVLVLTLVMTSSAAPVQACSLALIELDSNPTAGPPGTQVSISAPFWYVIGPNGVGADCSGLEYPATVDIVWTQGGESVTLAADVPTGDPAGSGFTTTVTVPASAAFGSAAIAAVPLPFDGCESCGAAFTVTDPNAPPVETPPEVAPRVTPRFTG